MTPLASKSLSRTALSLASVGAVVALSGCGLLFPPGPPQVTTEETPVSDDSAVTEESPAAAQNAGATDLRNGPIPAERPEFDEGELPPKPEGSDPAADIEWELLSSANGFAGAYDPASTSDCPATDGSADESITCTTVVNGLTTNWTVDITGGDYVFSYEYVPDEIPLARDAIEEALRYHADVENVACDMDEYQLGSLDSTGITCQAEDAYEAGEVTTYDVDASIYGSLSFYGRY